MFVSSIEKRNNLVRKSCDERKMMYVIPLMERQWEDTCGSGVKITALSTYFVILPLY